MATLLLLRMVLHNKRIQGGDQVSKHPDINDGNMANQGALILRQVEKRIF